jgi:hypothetical protein
MYGYGLEGPGFESREGQEIILFSETSISFLGPIPRPVKWVRAFLPGSEEAGA